MPASLVGAAQAEHFRIHDLAIDHQHEPFDRAHEFVAALAPAHAPRNRQARERVDNQTGKQVGQALAGPGRVKVKPASLVGLAPFELVDFDPAGRREA